MELAVNEWESHFYVSDSAKYDVFVALLWVVSMSTAYNS